MISIEKTNIPIDKIKTKRSFNTRSSKYSAMYEQIKDMPLGIAFKIKLEKACKKMPLSLYRVFHTKEYDFKLKIARQDKYGKVFLVGKYERDGMNEKRKKVV